MTTQPHTDVRTDLGRRGETLAARHLTSLGMQVLARNWRCPGGELDLVLRQGSTLIACEVKTRSGTGFGDPLDAITPTKQARLRRLLATWATEHGGGADVLRVDSVGIVWPEHERPLLRHVVGDLS